MFAYFESMALGIAVQHIYRLPYLLRHLFYPFASRTNTGHANELISVICPTSEKRLLATLTLFDGNCMRLSTRQNQSHHAEMWSTSTATVFLKLLFAAEDSILIDTRLLTWG